MRLPVGYLTIILTQEFPTDQEDTEKAQCEHGKSNDVRNEISQGAGVFPSVGL